MVAFDSRHTASLRDGLMTLLESRPYGTPTSRDFYSICSHGTLITKSELELFADTATRFKDGALTRLLSPEAKRVFDEIAPNALRRFSDYLLQQSECAAANIRMNTASILSLRRELFGEAAAETHNDLLSHAGLLLFTELAEDEVHERMGNLSNLELQLSLDREVLTAYASAVKWFSEATKILQCLRDILWLPDPPQISLQYLVPPSDSY